MYLVFGTLGIPSGGGGCAAHRPPHQKEKRKSESEGKTVGTAVIKASCDKARGVAKGMPKHRIFREELGRELVKSRAGYSQFPYTRTTRDIHVTC